MKLKKLVAISLSLALAAGGVMLPVTEAMAKTKAVATESVEESGHKITSKEVNLYWWKFEEPKQVTIHFVDGNKDVPYIEIGDFVALKNAINETDERENVIEKVKKKGEKVVLVRDNKSKGVFDFSKDTIHFDNFDSFVQYGFTDSLIYVLWEHETFEDGTPKYLKQMDGTVNRNGYPVDLNLSDYDIDMVHEGSLYLVPVQTLSDILLGDTTNFIAYNGKDLFVNDGSMEWDTYVDEFFSAEKGKRSKELAKFSYNELALALDFNYGQKEEQGIKDFKSLFESLGLKKDLLSSDPKKSAKALHILASQFFGGRHNLVTTDTYLVDLDQELLDEFHDIYAADNDDITGSYVAKYMNAREQYYQGEDELPPRYEEVGNTAFLTFDAFVFANEDYYEVDVTAEDIGTCYRGVDTVGLIKYAHEQIMREDSPIENVVIDLSNNSGGVTDAGAYLLAWVMGTAPVSVKDKATGATTTSYYRCDANFDGVYDEKDSLRENGKKVYCLTSPRTFSCGNYVPCVLKATDNAIIMGKTSGGGTCAVLPISVADGSTLMISGRMELSTVKNGTYYSVDKGVEPDVTITDLETMYNHNKLVEFINSGK